MITSYHREGSSPPPLRNSTVDRIRKSAFPTRGIGYGGSSSSTALLGASGLPNRVAAFGGSGKQLRSFGSTAEVGGANVREFSSEAEAGERRILFWNCRLRIVRGFSPPQKRSHSKDATRTRSHARKGAGCSGSARILSRSVRG